MRKKQSGGLAGALAALLLPGLLLAGCGADDVQPADVEVSIRETVTVADPQAAVDKIYEDMPEVTPLPLNDTLFQEHFSDIAGVSTAYFGCLSDPDDGLAEIVIVEPEEGDREAVRLSLQRYQEERIREFQNYNILNAWEIAQGAEVYDQGDYVILLMFRDNDAVRAVIDQYIPL